MLHRNSTLLYLKVNEVRYIHTYIHVYVGRRTYSRAFSSLVRSVHQIVCGFLRAILCALTSEQQALTTATVRPKAKEGRQQHKRKTINCRITRAASFYSGSTAQSTSISISSPVYKQQQSIWIRLFAHPPIPPLHLIYKTLRRISRRK